MRIVGATLGWTGYPQLAYEGEVVENYFFFFKRKRRTLLVIPYALELKAKGEYYPDGFGSWPKDPETGKKLEMIFSLPPIRKDTPIIWD